MTFLDQSHTGMHETARRTRTSERVGGRRYLTVGDAILLAAIALAGYVGSEFQGDTSQPAANLHQPPASHGLCSDEELRQMRSGPETCYDDPAPHGRKSELTAASGTINNT
jgi:hypothetical protein